jgi:SAM-dependent methyltransferase
MTEASKDSTASAANGPIQVNVGCGIAPTEGYLNFDNSPSLQLARLPLLAALGSRFGLWTQLQREAMAFARDRRISFANAARRIPLPDNPAQVVYSCHMCEHLSRADFARFLAEARRVLAPGGTLRLALPDLGVSIEAYRRDGDTDRFMENLNVAGVHDRTATFMGRVKFLLAGDRMQNWM